MKMKKIVILLASMATLVAVSVGGTLAYLTDKQDVENIFTIGDVKIGIVEDKWAGTKDKPVNIVPGQTVDKDPKVVNSGANDAWIRMKVEIPSFTPKGASEAIPLYKINALGAGWVKDGDYYYYDKMIAAKGGETEPLFTKVTLSSAVTETEGITENKIVCTAEAIQTIYNEDGSKVATAKDAFAVGYSNQQ